MALSWDEWIAILSIALPLIAKAFTDWSANTTANHNAALSRIVGMAGRTAATIAHALANLPPGTDPVVAKAALIANARVLITNEMADSLKVVGGDSTHVEAIVRGELDKVLPPVVSGPSVVVVEPAGATARA